MLIEPQARYIGPRSPSASLEAVFDHCVGMPPAVVNALAVRAELSNDMAEFVEQQQHSELRIRQRDAPCPGLNSTERFDGAAGLRSLIKKGTVEVDHDHFVVRHGLSHRNRELTLAEYGGSVAYNPKVCRLERRL